MCCRALVWPLITPLSHFSKRRPCSVLAGSGGHLQKKKKKSRVWSPCALELASDEWAVGNPRCPISPRGQFNSSQLDSLSHHHCYCCERRRRRAEAVGPSSLSGRESGAERTPHLLLQLNWSRYLRTLRFKQHCLKMERSFHPHKHWTPQYTCQAISWRCNKAGCC